MTDLHRDVTRTPLSSSHQHHHRDREESDGHSHMMSRPLRHPTTIIDYRRVEDIVIECTSLTNELEKTDQLMKERKDFFHIMWEEEQQRIMTEQSIFKVQV